MPSQLANLRILSVFNTQSDADVATSVSRRREAIASLKVRNGLRVASYRTLLVY
jgi:hypothetical protein